jgi:hypothetical protein
LGNKTEDIITKNLLGILDNQNQHIIQSTLMQVLETSYIIETSISPDTVIGRCSFLKENFKAILSIRTIDRFNIELQEAVDNYKQVYYDKTITEKQISIITKADYEYLVKFFLDNISRSFYTHIDKQLQEINALKKEDAKSKRRNKLFDLVIKQNPEVLRLFIYQTSNEEINRNLDEASKLQNDLYNYIKLKQDQFDEDVLIETNGVEYTDENEAPITDSARKMIKQIKIKLYRLQFEIRNQPYKIKLKADGTNVGLALDDKADSAFIQKIKNLFN